MDKEFYKKLLENMYDGVYFVDTNRKVTYWNASAERISGYKKEEVLGKSCADNVLRHVDNEGTELCIQGCPLAATMQDGEGREAEVYMHHKQGHRVPVHVRSAPIYDDDEKQIIVGAVEVFSSNQKNIHALETIKQLQEEILRDQLTRIGNRKFADLNLKNLLEGEKEHGVHFGLLMVDIDFFKKVNDTYGHNAGDKVLQMVARTISNGLRPLDIPCRWGGEEFVVMLPNITLEVLIRIGERLRMLIENSWLKHEDKDVRVTASFGGTISRPNDTLEEVVERADQQLYRCKRGGRNCVLID